ncbi:MAG: hypothetical protein ACYTE8_05575, partial [Planctomycetota bacterium]
KAVNMREAVNIVKKHNRTIIEDIQQIEKKEEIKEKPEPEIEQKPEQPVTQMIRQTIKHKDSGEQSQEDLLRSILEQLKSRQRQEMFGEFHIMRFFAGILQALVLFCLLLCIWLLMSPTKQQDNTIFISLGFAMVLQMMSLTLYIIQGRK